MHRWRLRVVWSFSVAVCCLMVRLAHRASPTVRPPHMLLFDPPFLCVCRIWRPGPHHRHDKDARREFHPPVRPGCAWQGRVGSGTATALHTPLPAPPYLMLTPPTTRAGCLRCNRRRAKASVRTSTHNSATSQSGATSSTSLVLVKHNITLKELRVWTH
jgi:hypothetical protein